MPLKALEVLNFSADVLDSLGNSGFRVFIAGTSEISGSDLELHCS